MDSFDFYNDIATRTNGDIYFGVVGPVRTGKSTFIKSFMELLALQNIEDKNKLLRAIDELPQSADGKTVMTTQPKFVPNEGVRIKLDNNAFCSLRMIDCVGYMVEGALGTTEEGKPRMVKTPWQDAPMSFEEAGEYGTTKVIKDHSTVGILMTTDGSITDLPRQAYIPAEEKAARELREHDKPFIIVVNTKSPDDVDTVRLADALSERYGAPAIPLNVMTLTEDSIREMISKLLLEFPINKLLVDIPDWIKALPYDNAIACEIIDAVKNCCRDVNKMSEIDKLLQCFEESDIISNVSVAIPDAGKGEVVLTLTVAEGLFYKVLTEVAGFEIKDEVSLMQFVSRLAVADNEYSKLKDALADVAEKGYGVVAPSFDDLVLEEPEIVRQQGRVGVRLKASAPSLHILRVDVETEVNPIVSSEQQGEEMVRFLLSEFENNKKGIWETNMFGKSLSELVREGLSNKLHSIPDDAETKLRKTLGRMINEGKGGMLCILL